MEAQANGEIRDDRPRIRLFGSFEFAHRDRVLGPGDLGGIKPKQVLEILLSARGHPVQKDRLVDLVWRDDLPRNALAALETYVSVIRSRLAPDGDEARRWVVTQPGAYRFAAEEVDLDLDLFDELVARARGAPVHEARTHLEEALRLVRGEPFEDEPYASWAERTRVRYLERVDRARLDAADAALAEGDSGSALDHVDHVVARDPLNERACRGGMLAEYAIGRQEAALRRYRGFRDRLREVAGTEPLPETDALFVAMLRHADLGPLFAGDRRRPHDEFRLLIEERGAALWWSTNAELVVTDVHGTALEAMGLEAKELIGLSINDLLPYPEPVEAHRRALLGEVVNQEIELRGRVLQAHVEPMRGAQGRATGVVGVALDVTERRRAEAALDVHDRFGEPYEAAPLPTFVWRRVGGEPILVYANRAAVEASAGLVDDLLGRTIDEVHADRPDVAADIRAAFAGRTRIQRHIGYTFPSGEEHRLAVTYAFVEPDRVVIHAQDETELHRERATGRALQDVFLKTTDAILIADLDDDEILEASAGACDLLGFERDDLLAHRLSSFHPEEMPRIEPFLRRAPEEEWAWSDDFTIVVASAALVPVELAAREVEFHGRPSVIILIRPILQRRSGDPALGHELAHLASATS